jgi:cytochrome c oxidase cbb3-type subunit 1
MSLKESKFIKSIATLHFVLYFILILLAVVTLITGFTTSKEYAELEWPLDILVVVVWVLFGVAMFGMIGLRRERTLYISVWYYIACFVAVAMLYLFNNMEVPTFLFANGAPSSFMNSISA